MFRTLCCVSSDVTAQRQEKEYSCTFQVPQKLFGLQIQAYLSLWLLAVTG